MYKIKRFFSNIRAHFSGIPTLIKLIFGLAVVVIISIILVIALAIQTASSNNDSPAQSSEIVTEVDDTTDEANSAEEAEETAETESEPEAETEDNEVVSTVNVFFNGTMVKTYSKEEAMASTGVNLSDFSDSRQVEVQAVIGHDIEVSRVRVWTENESGGSNGDEYFLYSDSNWSATLDLSDYSGTILVAVAVSDNSVPPHTEHSYFKVILPEDSGEETESAEQSEQEPTVTEKAADGTNPQMFINGIAVSGYQTFEEAVATPVAIATKELTLSANNVSDDISRISVQLGDSNSQIVGIECNPLTESNNWSQTVKVEDYEGEILVFNVTSEIGFAGGTSNQFIAVKL